MAGINDTLLIRKTKGSAVSQTVHSTLSEWNIACIEFPFDIGGETKQLYSNDWKDEHGEDTYIPDSLPMKAYDASVKFAYKGGLDTAFDTLTDFLSFLSGGDNEGASLELYHPHSKIGRGKCYLKQFADTDFTKSNMDEVLEFSVVFRVTDPVTSVTLTYTDE